MKRASDPRRFALHIDGKSDKDLLENTAYLEHFVRRIAAISKMTVVHLNTSNIKVDVSKLRKEVFDDEGGTSILALISTSHIALHVWPERSHFMFDLVSCKDFEASEVREAVEGELKVSKIEFIQVVRDAFTNTDFASKPYGNRTRLTQH